jgi:uncharacterized protein (TIGR03083 family)
VPEAAHPGAAAGELVDELASTWRSIHAVAESLRPEQWASATDLPGWTVQDLVSHMASIEAALLGRAEPEHRAPAGGHVRNPLGEWNEQRVDRRRSWSPQAVLAEFDETTAERETVLRAYGEHELMETVASPLGPMELRRFLQTRLLDSWLHEQEMRRAVGLPESLDTAAAARVLDLVLAGLPRAVAKAGLGDGESARVVVTGAQQRRATAMVRDGRGVAVDDDGTERRVTITGATGPFLRAATGRVAPARALDEGDVRADGDPELAERVLLRLNVMP